MGDIANPEQYYTQIKIFLVSFAFLFIYVELLITATLAQYPSCFPVCFPAISLSAIA